MSAGTNLNYNGTQQSFNAGTIGTFPELGVITAVVLAPKGSVIPAANMVSQSAFATYVNAKFINDTYSSRWFALTNLDKFEDATKAPNDEDTGRYQLTTYTFPPKLKFRYMQGMGNFIELTKISNLQGYDCFFIDDFGNWHGTQDITGGTLGLAGYNVTQLFVPNRVFKTTSTGNQYMFTISLSDPTQSNGAFKYYQANTQTDAIVMLQNAVMQDISDIIPPAVTTTSVTFTIKGGQDSYDVVKAYLSSLTAACFVATNLTSGGTVIAATPSSITTGTNVVSGQTYYWVKAVLSAAPTAGNVVRIALAAPSVVNAIIPNFNMESLALDNVNGQNCCIHTF